MTPLDEALTAKGLVNPVTIVAQSEVRLGRLAPQACAAFAVLCAQRLLDARLCLPLSEQRPFTLSLAPLLREIWSGLEKVDSSSSKATVQNHLRDLDLDNFKVPEDADEDAAAAAVFAAQAFCHGDVMSAKWAAGRLIDSVGSRVEAARAGLPADTLEEFAHPLMQLEANRLLLAFDILESQPWTPAMVPKLVEACTT